MKYRSILLRQIVAVLLIVLFSSCLLEQSVPIASSFSIELAEDKTAPQGEILSHLTRPKDEREYELSDTGVADSFFQEAADGFCSWFILQYMRGYKPFVTMMSKEVDIEQTLEE